jgi:rhamnulokinase
MAGGSQVFLAIDLGASSGRVVAGMFDGSQLTLEEVHRFGNGGIVANERVYWDALGQWREIQEGLRKAAQQFGERVVSVGVDTWGVDYALLGPGDELLGNPRNYRDPRTQGIFDRAFPIVSREEIFDATGLQFMEFNTLFQLLAAKEENPALLDSAQSFLMMPDLFNWLLTGEKVNEFTNASTTQFCDPRTRNWATSLLDRFGLPTSILESIVPPGERLGPLRTSVAEATGLAGVQVVLPGTHDTASAVVGVPAAGEASAHPDWCYISSGTWSLMGAETTAPVINDACREFNFTNEGGVGGTTRLLKNIAGLWLLQECQRVWRLEGRDLSWDDMLTQASAAPALKSLVNPDRPAFVAPKDMPAAIRQACREAGEPEPQSVGAVIRCALESLALRYRMVLDWTEQLTGGRIETIHIVGGGTLNRMLCQMAADACRRHVVAGPVEATAIGNVLIQILSSGEVGSLAEARQIIRASFDVETYEPQNTSPWDEAYARFQAMV